MPNKKLSVWTRDRTKQWVQKNEQKEHDKEGVNTEVVRFLRWPWQERKFHRAKDFRKNTMEMLKLNNMIAEIKNSGNKFISGLDMEEENNWKRNKLAKTILAEMCRV